MFFRSVRVPIERNGVLSLWVSLVGSSELELQWVWSYRFVAVFRSVYMWASVHICECVCERVCVHKETNELFLQCSSSTESLQPRNTTLCTLSIANWIQRASLSLRIGCRTVSMGMGPCVSQHVFTAKDYHCRTERFSTADIGACWRTRHVARGVLCGAVCVCMGMGQAKCYWLMTPFSRIGWFCR